VSAFVLSRGLRIATLCAAVLPWCAHAESLTVCYNYGCQAQARIELGESDLREPHLLLSAASDAESERRALSVAIGLLYAAAGRQSPIWRDRGGNYDDDGVDGRMDCIDHSTNTTAFLELLEHRGWLRFHAVLKPVWRGHFLTVHRGARIQETATGKEFIVDSWFFDNGEPAAVFALKDWMGGARARTVLVRRVSLPVGTSDEH
jgi:hypothetical protein